MYPALCFGAGFDICYFVFLADSKHQGFGGLCISEVFEGLVFFGYGVSKVLEPCGFYGYA
jgi:hypothetical protein